MNIAASKSYLGNGRYLQWSLIRGVIHKLEFRQDDDVLDVGCGTGEETKPLATKVRSVTGIDISEEMLAIARTDNPWPNITYSVGDAQTCGDNPEWRERFDKVVSFFVLHWCQDQTKALRSILTCLKPGGEGLFVVANSSPLAAELDSFLKSHSKWGEYVKGYDFKLNMWGKSIDEAETLYRSCGWTNVQTELLPCPIMSAEQTKLFYKTILGHTSRIPESMQEEYLEDLWQWTFAGYKVESPPGHVQLTIEHIITHASRPKPQYM